MGDLGANFSVTPPVIDYLHPVCNSPPPTNASCPPTGCGYAPPPICFESGFHGECTFTSEQPEYYFGMWIRNVSEQRLFEAHGIEIQFTVQVG